MLPCPTSHLTFSTAEPQQNRHAGFQFPRVLAGIPTGIAQAPARPILKKFSEPVTSPTPRANNHIERLVDRILRRGRPNWDSVWLKRPASDRFNSRFASGTRLRIDSRDVVVRPRFDLALPLPVQDARRFTNSGRSSCNGRSRDRSFGFWSIRRSSATRLWLLECTGVRDRTRSSRDLGSRP